MSKSYKNFDDAIERSKPKSRIIYLVHGVRYKCHPFYDLYAISKCGKIINIKKQIPMKGFNHRTGYLHCMVRKYKQKKPKKVVNS